MIRRIDWSRASSSRNWEVRTALLPQPGGFEGIGSVEKCLDASNVGSGKVVEARGGLIARDAALLYDCRASEGEDPVAVQRLNLLHDANSQLCGNPQS